MKGWGAHTHTHTHTHTHAHTHTHTHTHRGREAVLRGRLRFIFFKLTCKWYAFTQTQRLTVNLLSDWITVARLSFVLLTGTSTRGGFYLFYVTWETGRERKNMKGGSCNCQGIPWFWHIQIFFDQISGGLFQQEGSLAAPFLQNPLTPTHAWTHTCPFHSLCSGCFLRSVSEAFETCFVTYDTNPLKPEQSTHPHPDPSRIRNKTVWQVRFKNIHNNTQPGRCIQEL